eukprot:NODE_5306_length_959_cov_81.340909_g5091_i0.p1 GENE.NODE_5306_length_959_cov_81.340909_g5091_i0~~NODE_5306_length_959_cov_81.340909_g5091_i0.p1  ORF type:complete len:232 (+),score=38.03 NODE_5306_length_959_cov_81.340909_g5091_i0:145-840(+)
MLLGRLGAPIRHVGRRFLTVTARSTPNVHAIKFMVSDSLLDDGDAYNFPSVQHAAASPLAKQLFELGNVRSVLITDDHLTVTKEEDGDWESLKPLISATIQDWKKQGLPVIQSTQDDEEYVELATLSTTPRDGDSDVILALKELLQVKVRPMVQQDGGEIRFIGFENGVVYVQLQGACETCASSTITLKEGIERLLMHYIPEVKDVQQVPAELADEMVTVWEAQGSFAGVI